MAAFPTCASLLGGKNAAITHVASAREFYEPIIPIVAELHGKGSSLREIARELENRGIRPRYGCRNGWGAAQVRRVLLRAAEQADSPKMLSNVIVSAPTQQVEEPAAADIALWLDGESRGYFSRDEIRALLAKNDVTNETPYFREGMGGGDRFRSCFSETKERISNALNCPSDDLAFETAAAFHQGGFMFNGSISDGTVTVPLQAAHLLCAALTESSRPVPPDANKANCFFNPAGREPGRGWIAVNRADLDRLDLNGLLTLTLTNGADSVPFCNLLITREPTDLSPSNTTDDPSAAFLVELADSRWRVKNPYFAASIAAMYNVSSNADGGTGGPAVYLASSLEGGLTPWTWAGMAEDIWGGMTAQLGTFPGLPFTPDGTPVGWIAQGVSAWDALCDVLERIGCTVVADLSLTANQYSIVRIASGDIDSGASVKIHDAGFKTIARGKFPFGVRVFFHKQLETPNMIPPFLMNEVYSVDVAGGIDGAEPGVWHPIWDDLPALVDGSATVTNTAELAARAQERGDDYFRVAQSGSRYWRRFSGLVNMLPGARINSVTHSANAWGVYTDVMAHPDMPKEGKACVKDYAGAGVVQDLVRLGFPTTVNANALTFPPGNDWSILFIDNSGVVSYSNNFTYNTSTFSVVNNAYFDIKNSKTFVIDDSINTFTYINIDNSTNVFKIYNEFFTFTETTFIIDLSVVNLYKIWNQTDNYFQIDNSITTLTIFNDFITITNLWINIDLSVVSEFFIWNQTDYYFKIDDNTSTVYIWETTINVTDGGVVIDIKNGDKLFYVWDETNYFLKIDKNTGVINLWNDTLKIENGLVIFDISLGGKLWKLWNQTNIYVIIDETTKIIKFSDGAVWFEYCGIAKVFWLDIYANITIGKPGVTTATGGFLYYWGMAGTPTGVPTDIKSGYYPLALDVTAKAWWYYDSGWKKMSGTPDGTAKGDIWVWDNAAWSLLPVGSDDDVLTADAGESLGVKWAPAGPTLPTGTNVGDLLAWDGTAWAVFAVGTDGQKIEAASGEPLGLKWVDCECGGDSFEPFTVTYDASTTFTPDFTGNVKVECWGRGGHGGIDGDPGIGGGGGGGEYAVKNSYAVTASTGYAVVIGTRLSVTSTYFVDTSTVEANRGADGSIGTGGAGGTGGTGDTTFDGGAGGNAVSSSGGGGGGAGGASGAGSNGSGLTPGAGGAGGGGDGGSGGGDGDGDDPGGGGSGANTGDGGGAGGGTGRVRITRIS